MEITLDVDSNEEAMTLFGLGDRNLKMIRDALPVNLSARNGSLKIVGEKLAVEVAARLLGDLQSLIRQGDNVPDDYIDRKLRDLEMEDSDDSSEESIDPAYRKHGPRCEIPPIGKLTRSRGQRKYVESVLQNDMVFCLGPAGSGKTFLAVNMAIGYLRGGDIRKIILCRPAVEAGEKLGFLPGDFQAKINPYLRPLYDALNEILDFEQVQRYIEREIIEVIPMAYMRGRTLNDAFIILDEGQNTTVSQMKMFLTRMGMRSKIVVTGDATQVDLPPGAPSGLIHARRLFRGIQGIGWIELEKQDILRHPLVKKIVSVYEKDDSRTQSSPRPRSREGSSERHSHNGEPPRNPASRKDSEGSGSSS